MITHPLIYCDWLEEQGYNVTFLREDLESLTQNKHRLISNDIVGDGNGCGWDEFFIDDMTSGFGVHFVRQCSGLGIGYGLDYGDRFGDGNGFGAFSFSSKTGYGNLSGDGWGDGCLFTLCDCYGSSTSTRELYGWGGDGISL